VARGVNFIFYYLSLEIKKGKERIFPFFGGISNHLLIIIISVHYWLENKQSGSHSHTHTHTMDVTRSRREQ